jgi:hypothetical protein
MRSWGRALTVVLWLGAVLVLSACASASTVGEQPTAQATSTRSEPPTATASQTQPMTCMPRPSTCGFPDVTNTGVTPGVGLAQVNGVVTLSQSGQVFENRQVTGSIVVTAPNVTIRNVRLIDTDGAYAISVKNAGSWNNSQANLVVDHVEINLNGHTDIKGIAFNGYTASHVFFHNGADCAHFGVNVAITDSLCVLGPDANGDGNPDSRSFCNGPEHFDGFQSDGGRNITLRHNTIRNPCSQTSAILMSTNTSPIDSVVIDGNLMSGGGYTVYCGTDEGGVATHETYTNNVISKEFYPKGGYWGPTLSCEKVDVAGGNLWDGNYIPPPSSGGPGNGGSPGGSGNPSTAITYLLTKRQARGLVRLALARELGRRYTRRVTRLRLSCHRRSRAVMACTVAWAGRRSHGGGRHRYSGAVTIERTASDRWRYSLRIRDKVGGGRSRLIKKSGSVSS